VRIVAWNIRAGGGRRGEALAAQLDRWRPDLVALSEFRGTLASATLARVLGELGLPHQLASCDSAAPSANCLLVAARWPLRPIRWRAAPSEPGRWLMAAVASPQPIAIGAMHVPNRVTGRKWDFLDAVLAVAQRWREGPALLVGDTNSGRPGIDEEVPAFNRREGGWVDGLERAGWPDAFRHLRGDERAYTWYSPNGGNGFRIDQAFVHRSLLPRVETVRYEWGRTRAGTARTTVLSDHAALLVDLRDGPAA
jgi:exodeoxyribonuclease III